MEEIVKRCKTLISQASEFRRRDAHYFPDSMRLVLQKWIASTVNIISITVPPNSYFMKECERILSDENFKSSVPIHIIDRLAGLLEGLCDEIETGFFRQLEYIFTASAFDDFLDHATHFHKGGKLIEASILASVIFEDTIRKIAKKNLIEEAGIDLETIINDLVTANVFTPVKAKRAKGISAIRNKALHAQWSEFDIKDVGSLIKETRELIDSFL